MSLTYLSGDDIGKSKRKSGGGTKRVKKTKAEKKQGRKRVFKKVAKVAVAPARVAFLTVVRLNALKLATKLVRVYKHDGGPEQLQKFWTGFGGDFAKLKQAMAKGSKQSINADYIGVAVATAIATATPIIVALVPIIKQFKASGDKKEAKEFDEGVNQGKKDLAEDTDVPKAEVSMPQNKDVGVVADKNGNSTEDTRQEANAPESKSGGSDKESANDDTPQKSGKITKSEAEKTMSSTFSPLGFFLMVLMYSLLIHTKNTTLQTVISILNTYALLVIVCIPFALNERKNYLQRIAYAISYVPFNYLSNLILKLKWQKY